MEPISVEDLYVDGYCVACGRHRGAHFAPCLSKRNPKPTPKQLEKALELATEIITCDDCPIDNDCVGLPKGVDDVEPTERCNEAIKRHFISMAMRPSEEEK